MKVKICGVTRYADARLALDLGAWALGLNFYARSPRFIAPDAAAALLKRLPKETLSFAVVVDEPRESLQQLVDHVGVRCVQLHGDEPPELARALRAEIVVKAFRVGPSFELSRLGLYPGPWTLLDASVPGQPGGTGRTFDWSIARKAAETASIILAGGITPSNVAVALAAAAPAAIDVASGIESSPGIKDPDKLRALFRAVG